jgi:hypothetical protein
LSGRHGWGYQSIVSKTFFLVDLADYWLFRSNGQETLDSFKKAASTAEGSTIPVTVQGGFLGKSGGDTSSSTTSESSGTTSSTASPTNAGNSVGNALDMCILLVLASSVALSMM